MSQKDENACPTCMGKGTIEGVCETSSECDRTKGDVQIGTPDHK